MADKTAQDLLNEGYSFHHVYQKGLSRPNYPVPAVRQCPLCQSKHIGHSHFVYEDGLIVPN